MLLSFRMPIVWQGKVSDQRLRTWLHEFTLRRPRLPADPGPGRFKRSFRVSESETQIIGKLAAGDVSSFLRPLIALHLGSPEKLMAARDRFPKGRTLLSQACTRTSALPQEHGRAQNRSPAHYRPLAGIPSILTQACKENGYSPMWRDGQWVRRPRTPEEGRAYQELMEARLREEQRRRHAWEMRVGATCTCGVD